eukprot:14694-Heterococcus_DN1.PRE.3
MEEARTLVALKLSAAEVCDKRVGYLLTEALLRRFWPLDVSHTTAACESTHVHKQFTVAATQPEPQRLRDSAEHRKRIAVSAAAAVTAATVGAVVLALHFTGVIA